MTIRPLELKKFILTLNLSFVFVVLHGCTKQVLDDQAIYEAPTSLTPSIHAIEEDFIPDQIPYGTALGDLAFSSVKKAFKGSKKQNSYDDIWERLFNLFAIPDYNNERVNQEIQWFMKHPKYLSIVQERAEPYLHSIVEEVEATGIPGELALLPIVESAFKPYAYSHSHASGLWQFIPSTGKDFGLQQNWWYDGRRDIYASTKAAVSYLKQLGDHFKGDWLLALASYNAGQTAVDRRIRRNEKKNLATDYWSLNLPNETRHYVPKLLAVAKLLSNSDQYNIPLYPIPNKPVFSPIEIEAPLDLEVAAQLADMSIDDFFLLNPGFNRWMTGPKGPHRLLIPIEKVKPFKQKLAKLSSFERTPVKRHTVKKGETLSVIAKKYATSVKRIKQVNQLNGSLINVGNKLIIPPSKHLSNQKHTQERLIYTVKKGDSLYAISKKFKVSIDDLRKWNNEAVRKSIRPGQKLTVMINPRKSAT